MKRIYALMLTVVMLAGVLAGCAKTDDTAVDVGVLKGPTGIGAVEIMSKSDKGEYAEYNFTLTADVTDIVARLTNGDLDIGALPTNTAANLYNKTNGDVEIIAINCLSVLYVLENGDTVKSAKDLKGRTIYCNGQGANPEYMINYILRGNGLEPGKDVELVFAEPGDITAKMVSGEIDLCMLPVPAVTTIMMKNANVRKAIDVAKAYDEIAADSSRLTMGCLVARKEFIEEHPAAIEQFVNRYDASIKNVLDDIDAAAELVAEYEITGSAQIAKAAIGDCGIVCITGKEMKPALDGYYKVLFDASPASIGGAIPGEDFYYVK